MRRALITGAAGQDGTYLAELLLERGYEVFGIPGPDLERYRAWTADKGGALMVVEADMRDAGSLSAAVEASKPDEVYNLAALSSVAASWEQPELYADINGIGALRMLRAVAAHAPGARFVQASSAEIFGDPNHVPQDEDTPIRPINPYGAAKAFAHFTVTSMRTRGMHASNAIMYNHESPRRPVDYVSAKIARAVADIRLGRAEKLTLGNVDAVRDWGFAGDYVEALTRIAAADEPGDYVVATGVGRTVRDFAEAAFAHVGLEYDRYVEIDASLYRPTDVTAEVGDATRIRERLGWTPTTTFEAMVGAMVDEQAARLRERVI